jgi:hypothetical protein
MVSNPNGEDLGTCLGGRLTRLLRLRHVRASVSRRISYPGEGTNCCRQAQCTDSQHGNMIDLILRDSYSSRISDGGVRRAFQPGTHREGNFHQAPGLFIHGTCRVAPVTQFIEGFPHLGVALSEVLYRLIDLFINNAIA